ncbi:Uncharacterized protein Adt_45057 [Abeliophyllum distichum]|uniref:Reverse transcriptase domain-containing protein n=1 Tax=Abeliophyllum distichum TaxID=126358 RepID=A0ABD1PCQ3_9LAMI
MLFGLKNACATYQRLVNKMFAKQLGNTMDVYVDDMLVKSLVKDDHIKHLEETFVVLRKYKMKLNPLKCTFGITLGKFLWFMLNEKGIQMNLEKIRTIFEMNPPRTQKEIHSESKAGARIMLISPEGHKLHSAIRFGFPPSNNVAVYEATLAGLRLVKALQVKAIIVHNSRADNYNNDAFLKIDSSKDSNLLGRVPVEFFAKPSTEQDDNVLSTESTESWIKSIMAYLKD